MLPLLALLLWAALLPGAAPSALAAAPVRFDLPLSCDMRSDCFIQQYFDHDPGPDYADYTCGRLSYDGHTGTDFRVRDLVQMEEGVAVLAAADGTVRAVRDGMDDVSVNVLGVDALDGKFAGNSVVLVHLGGLETQYSHLRKGSVCVHPGQQVKRGEVLGQVGLSGRTEFPHLEFAVRVDDEPVDPFRGLSGAHDCGLGERPLWTPATLAAMPYEPTRLLAAGFASRPPSRQEVALRLHTRTRFTPRSRALIFWVRVAGLLAGDELDFILTGPDGVVLARHEQTIETSKAQFFQYVGKHRGKAPWPEGGYSGRFVLRRKTPGGMAAIMDESRRAVIGH